MINFHCILVAKNILSALSQVFPNSVILFILCLQLSRQTFHHHISWAFLNTKALEIRENSLPPKTRYFFPNVNLCQATPTSCTPCHLRINRNIASRCSSCVFAFSPLIFSQTNYCRLFPSAGRSAARETRRWLQQLRSSGMLGRFKPGRL